MINTKLRDLLSMMNILLDKQVLLDNKIALDLSQSYRVDVVRLLHFLCRDTNDRNLLMNNMFYLLEKTHIFSISSFLN